MKNEKPIQTTRREFIQTVGAGAVTLALAGSAAAQTREIPPIVSPDWLVKNLGDSKLVILDIRSAEQYRKGHIPSAINAPMSSWAISANGLSLELPPENQLGDLLSKSGVDSASHVLIVNRIDTDFSRADATRVAWTCILAGIRNVAVLDGGYNRWLRDVKTVSTETVTPTPRTCKAKYERSFLATKTDVLGKIGKSIIVDARIPEEYFGITSKPGHIKSAVNLPTPWAFTENGTFRKEEDLLAMTAGVVGTNKSKEVIVYCGVGGYASTWWFVLTQLFGYRDVKVYDGSMEEWLKDASGPVGSYSWH